VVEQIYAGTFARAARNLYMLLFMIVILVVVISSTINLVEWSDGTPSQQLLDDNGRSLELQRVCYGTILNSFWWSLVTITTVGYGDCTPITTAGKVVGAITTVLGAVCLSMPIAIVGNSFVRMVDVFDEEDDQQKASMTKLDVREYVWQLKQDGTLRTDQPEGSLQVDALMAALDGDHDGVLQLPEVERLRLMCKRDMTVSIGVSAPTMMASSLNGEASHQECGSGGVAVAAVLAAQSEQLSLMGATLQRQQALLERQDERMARLESALEKALARNA